MVNPSQVVSPRRIGGYIDKLGITKFRDNQGFYILVPRELAKIKLLVDRYGLTEVLEEERIKREAGIPRHDDSGDLMKPLDSEEFIEDETPV